MAGRTQYTDREDVAMWEFLVDEANAGNSDINFPCGNQIWQTAASRHVTNHSVQSMRDRFRRILYLNVENAPLEPDEKDMLSQKWFGSKMPSNKRNKRSNKKIRSKSPDVFADFPDSNDSRDEQAGPSKKRHEKNTYQVEKKKKKSDRTARFVDPDAISFDLSDNDDDQGGPSTKSRRKKNLTVSSNDDSTNVVEDSFEKSLPKQRILSDLDNPYFPLKPGKSPNKSKMKKRLHKTTGQGRLDTPEPEERTIEKISKSTDVQEDRSITKSVSKEKLLNKDIVEKFGVSCPPIQTSSTKRKSHDTRLSTSVSRHISFVEQEEENDILKSPNKSTGSGEKEIANNKKSPSPKGQILTRSQTIKGPVLEDRDEPDNQDIVTDPEDEQNLHKAAAFDEFTKLWINDKTKLQKLKTMIEAVKRLGEMEKKCGLDSGILVNLAFEH